MAAALNVSAAPRTTLLPLFLSCNDSLPIVVVLPTPFTPITNITEGFVSSLKPSSSPNISTIISFIKFLISAGSVMPVSLILLRSLSHISTEVSTPISDITSVSSSCSNSSSSILVKLFIIPFTPFAIESRVFLSPSLILPKNPIFYLLSKKNYAPFVRSAFSSSATLSSNSFVTPFSCIVTP